MKLHPKRSFILLIWMIFILFSPYSNNVVSQESNTVEQSIGSIILMIGDGMGFEQVNLARLVEVGLNGNLTMDLIPNSRQMTTVTIDGSVTDSSAGATAIGTGNKTIYGHVGLDDRGKDLQTILEYAQTLEKSTGLVTTTEITDATPAAFASHVDTRQKIPQIIDQFSKSNVDIFLGGGSFFFAEDNINSFINRGYTLVKNAAELSTTTSNKLLGLFNGNTLSYELVRNSSEPSLSIMASKTLELLSQDPNGFFVMIEGGLIDRAGHVQNKTNVALETIEFDKTVKLAMDYVDNHENTLLIVTADHETLGLKINGNSLGSDLPRAGLSAVENLTLRINRAASITVDFQATYHTDFPVPFYFYGIDNPELPTTNEIDNSDVFPMMKAFFNSTLITRTISATETSTSSSLSSNTSSSSKSISSETSSGFEVIFIALFVPIILVVRKRRKI